MAVDGRLLGPMSPSRIGRCVLEPAVDPVGNGANRGCVQVAAPEHLELSCLDLTPRDIEYHVGDAPFLRVSHLRDLARGAIDRGREVRHIDVVVSRWQLLLTEIDA
jgi:hypothetical protein